MSVSVANGANIVVVVLVVEDDFIVRFEIADVLRDAGYVVYERTTGEQAIALCRSETVIDLVFTDINLGSSATGWDVAECFRKERPDVSVLLTSGNSKPARRVPGCVFIPKPYRNRDILDACRQLRPI